MALGSNMYVKAGALVALLTQSLLGAVPVYAAEEPAAEDPEVAAEDPDAAAADPASGEKPAEARPADPAKPAEVAAEEPSILDELDDGSMPILAPTEPTKSYPYVEYHGYFRFRPDLISNGHLGIVGQSAKDATGKAISTSAILPPLSLWETNNDPNLNPQSSKVGKSREEDSIAGASIRFRLQPTFHIDPDIRIAATFDIFDNYVLGSNPDYSGALKRADVPLAGFAMSTKPGYINVKEAYAEWKMLLGLLRVGRQASQWGLGIIANGGAGDGWDMGKPTVSTGGPRRTWEGSGYDNDYGNFSDRAAFLTKIPKAGIYVSLFYDYIANGLTALDATRADGVVRDLDSSDDVRQYGFALFQRPLTEDEAAQRRTRLEDERKPGIDWGLNYLYRTQDLDVTGTKNPATIDVTGASSQQLMVRNARAHIADVWARYERRFSPLRRFVVEGEFATIFGTIADTNTEPGQVAKERELMMWGGAIKTAFQDEGMGYFLDLGIASGDDTGCFGVSDAPWRADCTLATADGKSNAVVTGMKFNRGFRVDSLLFRDVIGGVTNAVYAKPTISINAYPWTQPEMLGLDLSVLVANAVQAKGTPSGEAFLGTELSARGFLGKRGQVYADVLFSYLLTGAAFDLKKDWYGADASISAENAWRLMGHVVVPF